MTAARLNPNVNRRTVLKGSLAALATTPVMANPAPDAELLSLCREWREVRHQRDEHLPLLEAAEKRYFGLRPHFPKACLRQERDVDLRLCADSRVGEPYEREMIDQRRGHIYRRYVGQRVTGDIRREHGSPDEPHTLSVAQPWAEAQARSDEIIAAWDRHNVSCEAAEVKSGLKDAQAHDDRLSVIEADLITRIVSLPATTLEGLRGKAAIANVFGQNVAGLGADIADMLKAREDWSLIAGVSIARDLLALQGRLS